jgi:hypothetical protein
MTRKRDGATRKTARRAKGGRVSCGCRSNGRRDRHVELCRYFALTLRYEIERLAVATHSDVADVPEAGD